MAAVAATAAAVHGRNSRAKLGLATGAGSYRDRMKDISWLKSSGRGKKSDPVNNRISMKEDNKWLQSSGHGLAVAEQLVRA